MEGVSRLMSAVAYMREHVSSELPAQQMHILFLVALNPGISKQELGKQLDMPSGSVSRNIQALSDSPRRVGVTEDGHPIFKSVGVGLIDSRIDVDDTRRHVLHLTKQGQEVLKCVDLIIQGKKGEVIIAECKGSPKRE